MILRNVEDFFSVEIFCNIINAFTDTFDQFNASSLNKNLTDQVKILKYEIKPHKKNIDAQLCHKNTPCKAL